MNEKEFRKELEKIIKSGRIGDLETGITTWCDVGEISFEEIIKLNEKFPIDCIDGHDIGMITIYFK